jgi:glycerol uptake facilitator-like aquaporin
MLAGDYLRRGVAELVGTFALILVGEGAETGGDIAAAGTRLYPGPGGVADV